uniref:Si:ch211-250c4.4 n=1 Tax=Fundulus heteroclitus TaxID=8078 RepID=A0A3Q2PEC0_FUNHE
MSMKRKKAGLVISWQRSFSILAPWRKRNAVLDSEVVLTKMKLFNNFNEKLLMAEDSVSTVSTASVSDQDTLDPSKASETNSHLEDKPQIESGSEYLPAIFSISRLSRLYKFESEDSGVELPSGANSPSTPTGSEKSFVVHSRESSCASCNLYSGSTSPNPQAQQQRPSPLGSGFGYLEHICQLLEKIGCLQEINLRLQRQICSLQKDSKMTKTKEEFFQQYCSCGASILAFQNWQSKSDLSLGGTFSDLSTIPEVNWHPLMSARKWKRCLNRRSYAEGELSDNYMWGRVKDLVRKTKVRNQSRLGLTSTSLKMSCPQLYPDEEQVENGGRNRNSMIALG